jgi:hypothetical protein
MLAQSVSRATIIGAVSAAGANCATRSPERARRSDPERLTIYVTRYAKFEAYCERRDIHIA